MNYEQTFITMSVETNIRDQILYFFGIIRNNKFRCNIQNPKYRKILMIWNDIGQQVTPLIVDYENLND